MTFLGFEAKHEEAATIISNKSLKQQKTGDNFNDTQTDKILVSLSASPRALETDKFPLLETFATNSTMSFYNHEEKRIFAQRAQVYMTSW